MNATEAKAQSRDPDNTLCASLIKYPPPPTSLTMSLGRMMMTCHTVAFVLSLLALSCLVLLHHSPHSFFFHVSSEVVSAQRDNRKLWQVVRCGFGSNSVLFVVLSEY